MNDADRVADFNVIRAEGRSRLAELLPAPPPSTQHSRAVLVPDLGLPRVSHHSQLHCICVPGPHCIPEDPEPSQVTFSGDTLVQGKPLRDTRLDQPEQFKIPAHFIF